MQYGLGEVGICNDSIAASLYFRRGAFTMNIHWDSRLIWTPFLRCQHKGREGEKKRHGQDISFHQYDHQRILTIKSSNKIQR